MSSRREWSSDEGTLGSCSKCWKWCEELLAANSKEFHDIFFKTRTLHSTLEGYGREFNS